MTETTAPTPHESAGQSEETDTVDSVTSRPDAAARAAIQDGQPGEYFIAEGQEGSTYVWKLLDGQDLLNARECGYEGRVASIVTVWDGLNPPHSPKTDELDPPYGMVSVEEMPPAFFEGSWVRCEQLRPMFELNGNHWVPLESDSGFYH